MTMSGSIRRTERKIGRSLVGRSLTDRSIISRESTPLFAFPDGTAQPGPGVHFSGLGSFLPVRPPDVRCTAFKSAPQRAFTSYVLPLERKYRWRANRSNSHE